ncbi:hypothetical protein [Roseivirga echinicomitans]|uniref:Macroglobulin domain-containing protein n=1 Tax=Roseivirga echinicomitans TaxID=296218 RepID=A0A150XCY8_9BACT|nr:hypothetical protein [Roseivirga echinicomitans]KYG76583.1 hypothetical protein AWN68_06020 [Roseivirga echinicomitans]
MKKLIGLLFFIVGLQVSLKGDLAAQTPSNEQSIYLQLNKSVFELGEDLWFSATVLNAQSLLPSSLDSSLFVELRSKAENQVVFKEIFEISNGFSEGHLFLADTLKQGEYSLFAFTRNSFSDEVKKTKSILLKSRITPTILVDVNFDNVLTAELNALSPKIKVVRRSGELVTEAKINAEIWSENKRLARVKTTTDSLGIALPSFNKLKAFENLILKIDVDSNLGEEQFELPVALPSNTQRIQFNLMPEGGSLVQGISTQIAFKAVHKNGAPVEIDSAIVLDEKGSVVTSFKSRHNGMGSFYILPLPSKQYSVSIISPKIDSVFSFPKVYDAGFVLNVSKQTEDDLLIAVKKSEGFEGDSLTFSIEQRGQLFYESMIIMSGDGVPLKVPTVSLPKGIIKVSLSNSEGQKLAERLVFVNNQKKLNITYELNKANYTTKERIDLKLKVTNDQGQPVQTVIGMSVVDEVFKSVFDEDNIVSYFFLSNEIRGQIHNPKSYFSGEVKTDRDHLDLLMLTQGWRSYRWPRVQSENLTDSDLKVSVKINPNSVTNKVLRALDQQKIQVVSMFGASILNTDKNGELLLTDSMLYWSKGGKLFFKVDEVEGALLNFHTPFDATVKWSWDKLDQQKRIFASTKNWNILPQVENDVRRLDDFVVESHQDQYGVAHGNARNIIEGRNTDYVCMYNILNCTNHLSGREPRDGEKLFINGVFKTYRAPKEANSTRYFNGYYEVPEVYEPDYDKVPEDRVFTDFRNSLIWRPSILTNENGEAEISFFTSDIRSIFNVHIDAYGDNGQMGALKFDIKVLK